MNWLKKNPEKADKLLAANPFDQENTWQSVHFQRPHRAEGIAQDVTSAEERGTGRHAPVHLHKKRSPSKPGFEKKEMFVTNTLAYPD